MPITRAKATALLNKGEMQLYDDSRSNAVRGFDASQIESRITRARSARNRARDLVQRQKLASRDRTGNKRGTSGAANQRSKDKAEILADVLKRFEAQLKVAKKAGKPAAKSADSARTPRKTSKKAERKAERSTARGTVRKAAKKAVAKKPAAKKTTAKKTATRKAAPKKAAKAAKEPSRTAGVAKKATGKAVAKKAREKSGKAASGSARRSITPKKALRNTRQLLEARQEEARQPKPWQSTSKHGGQVSAEGFQSTAAAHRAEELHAAQSRIPAIHGSIGTRGRINQGKRDNRGTGVGED